jgi:hypothetical protein
VHSRISCTSSQLDRPTPRSPPRPHGEPELTITVHTSPQRRGTSLVEEYGYELENVEEPDTEGDNHSAQSGETDLEAVEAADEKGEETRISGKSRAVTPTSCHQTLSDRFRRDPPDDDDEDLSPDTRSISTHSSLGKRGNRVESGSNRRKRRQQREEAAADLLRLRGGAGSPGFQTTTASTLNLERQFDVIDTATTTWELEGKVDLPDPGPPYGITRSGLWGIVATAGPPPPQPAGTALAATAETSQPQPAGTASAPTAEPPPPRPAGTADSQQPPSRRRHGQPGLHSQQPPSYRRHSQPGLRSQQPPSCRRHN